MSSFEALTFVQRDDNEKIQPWQPNRDGTWSEQNYRGRAYASELAFYIADSGDVSALGKVFAAIKGATLECGVAVGFCAELAELAARGTL